VVFVSISLTVYSSGFNSLTIFVASSFVFISNLSNFLPLSLIKLPSTPLNIPSILQYSCGLNALISLSLSTTSFSAALWTLPALNPF